MGNGRGDVSVPVGVRVPVLVAVLVGIETVVLLVVALLGDRTTRAVTVALDGRAPAVLSRVDLDVAMVVVLALVAVARALPARRAWVLDPLLTTPITLFVIAQLNGVRDVGALVGIYALASAGVLFAVVQDRSAPQTTPSAGSRVPLGLGSAVGIVPWGIVAFHQVGAGVVGHPLPGIAVVVTLTALVAAIAEFVATWRGRHGAASVLRTVGMSVVAWLVVLGL
ncbi:hypothetical protein ASG04_01945 [Curtobacterium sp. Leaf183]|uniref:hypothetical protein n=1 Tax=Curtobacterium sp. Leaf183 TaxID=1736291 RepID=UPI0006F4EDCE|nr:hypothetical protein [Curtobacterium sp. Leaf183]KQS14631.1 hypothetical protein ASG04_01945 [Curtobacterium sp. Leaf183]